jgi:hypothetical protein
MKTQVLLLLFVALSGRALARPGDETVVRQMPGFKAEDAAVLAKVRQAFAAAPPSLLAHTRNPVPSGQRGLFSPLARREYNPRTGKTEWSTVKTKSGLARYGGYLDTLADGLDAFVVMASYVGWPAPLAANTSGIIWDTEQVRCIFVTVDGGRYFVPCNSLEPGLAPVETWPPPLQHSLLLPYNVVVLAEMGELPSAAGEQMKQGFEAFSRCGKEILKTREAELQTNRTANITEPTRRNRHDAIWIKYDKLLHDKCSPMATSLEPALAKWIHARDAERLKLYENLKAARH